MLCLCRTILARAMGPGADPVQLDVSVKPFPWPSVRFDPAAIAAAAAFNLLLVFAFLTPTRGAVATIVREKELRLREGMRILGLKVSSAAMACYPSPVLASMMLTCARPIPLSSRGSLRCLKHPGWKHLCPYP